MGSRSAFVLEHTMRLHPLRAAIAAALVPAFIAVCSTSTAAPAPLASASQATPAQAAPDFTRLVNEAGPAVVNISVTKQAVSQAPVDRSDPLYPFFRHFNVP